MTLRERLLEHKQMEDYDFAKKIYANLCNLVWYDYVNDEAISHSWRGAGGFVASIRNESFDLRFINSIMTQNVLDSDIKQKYLQKFNIFLSSNNQTFK